MPYQLKDIILSSDGVAESKSSSTSLKVYSIRFEGCRQPYVFGIIRPSCPEGAALIAKDKQMPTNMMLRLLE
jgi:hypothetical protein